MTIQELTDAMNRFVEAMGWYAEDSPCPQTPRNIAISLGLEAGEVLELFQWDEQADRDALRLATLFQLKSSMTGSSALCPPISQ